jgi:carboxymethylenebutenolidase
MLIIPDYFDPEHYYYDLADQYAAEGYMGVCPDVFHRYGKLAEQTHPAATERIGKVGDDEAIQDIDTLLEYLKSEGLLGPLAITGFCWGGRIAYLVAARHPETKVLVEYYGHLTAWSGPDGNKPYSPLDEADKIRARVVGSYGGADSIPLDEVAAMENKLKAAGVIAELRVYDGAEHCFFRTPEKAAESDHSWERVLVALQESMA